MTRNGLSGPAGSDGRARGAAGGAARASSAATASARKARTTREAKALAAWEELNERQRAYLEEAYRADQAAEEAEGTGWRYGERRRPADEWRWILYGRANWTDAPLINSLARRGLVDKGTGSTWRALEVRGLIRTRTRRVKVAVGRLVGTIEVLDVRLETKGRREARAGLGEAAPGKPAPGTLREWHWRALARAYAAGAEGLGANDYSRGFGGIGQRTWERLLRYEGGGFGALAVERTAGDWGSMRQRLYVTPDGMSFYRARREEYRSRYPGVDAPPDGSGA